MDLTSARSVSGAITVTASPKLKTREVIQKVMPEIIKSAAKVIMTPIKSSKDEDLNN